MGEVVNLRMARKGRARAEAVRKADENRARFGRTKSEKLAEEAAAKRHNSLLDSHRREDREKP